MSQILSRNFRDIKYRFFVVFAFFATLNTRDFWNFVFSRHSILVTFSTRDFSISYGKMVTTFDFLRNLDQNQHEIKKMIGDIRYIKYPRLLN